MAEEENLTLESALDSRRKENPSCLQRLSLKLKLTEEGATLPNWKYIGLVFAALFSSASTLTFLFPFLPEMVLTFGYSENEKGTYAGLVASSVFAGRIVGSPFWGWLTDRIGRKSVFLFTIALNGTFTFLFGFSKNLVMAMIFRFLCGAANGTVGTAKAVIYDISDNSNQAISMTMLSISWGLGMVVGPTVGGFLADPAKKWPGVFSEDGLFGEYPYLLASLFPFVSCLLIFMLIFFKFENTFNESYKTRKDSVEISDPDSSEVENNLAPVLNNSQKDSYAPLLKLPLASSKIYLSRSVNSLHMEAAQTSAFFAHEMLRKRENPNPNRNSDKGKTLNAYSIFVSVPNLTQPMTPAAPEPTLSLFLSTPDIATAELKPPKESSTRRTNSFGNQCDLKLRSNAYVCQNLERSNAYNRQNSETSNTYSRQTSENVNGNAPVIHRENQDGVEVTVTPVKQQLSDSDSALNENQVATWNTNGVGDQTYVEVSELETAESSPDQEEENVCGCMEVTCSSYCCLPCRNSSLATLLRLKNVWASTMLYVIFSFVIIGVEDIFPVFASTQVDYGGLGFSTDKIGLAIGATFLPLLFLQIKLYPFLVSKMGIIKVFQYCAIGCMLTGQLVPCVRLLNNSPVWLWTCLMLIQVPFKICTNCCFAGSALLINNSVTPDLAGQANGLAMMATAIGRTIAPAFAGSLFSWSVTYGPAIGVPFDTSFAFFVLSLLFVICVIECLNLDPKLDQQRK